MKILISLIGGQTIPNVLCIDHYKPDMLLMVATEKMRTKTRFILSGLRRIHGNNYFSEKNKNLWTIDVDPESLANVRRQLEKWFNDYNQRIEQCDEIIVNVTGGTKMMCLGLFNAVKLNKGLPAKKFTIVYIPINSNKIVDLTEDCQNLNDCEPSVAIDRRLNIIQYFESNGVSIVSNNDSIFNNGFDNHCEQVRFANETAEISKLIMRNYDVLKGFLGCLLKQLDNLKINFKKKHKIHDIDICCTFNDKDYDIVIKLVKELFSDNYLQHFTVSCEDVVNNNFIRINGKINKHEYKFLTGSWLERFCFNELKDLKEQGIFNDLGINVNVRNNETGMEAKNEFDVLFTYNNNLYMVECKTLNQGHDTATDILYKISALQADLGRLTTKSFLASTASKNIMDEKRQGEIKEHLKQRAKLLNCSIIKPVDLLNIKEEIKKELHIN